MRPHRGSWGRRATRIIARTLAGAFLALVGLAAVASVVVYRALRPERLRPMVVNQLERTFQRRVDIGGIGVAPLEGVRVTDIKVHSRPGAPEEFFLSAEVMVARFSVSALLRGRFVLSKVRLVNPRVALYRREGGLWNLEEMLLATRGAKEGGGLSLPPLSAAEEIRLEGGTIRLVDPVRGLDTTLRDVFLSVDDFRLDAPFPMRVKLAGDGTFRGKPHSVRLESDLELQLAAFTDERTAVSVRRLVGNVDGRPVSASGRVRNLVLPDFDFKASLPALTSAEAQELGVAVSSGIALPPSTWQLRVRTTAVDPSTTTPGAYFVDSFVVAADPWRVEASGRMNARTGAVSGVVKTRSAPLAAAGVLYAPWAEQGLGGTLDATLALGGTLAKPKVVSWAVDLRGFSIAFWNGKRFSETDMAIRAGEGLKDLSVKVAKGTYIAYSNALSDLEAEVRLSSGDLAVPRLDVTWNGSRFKLKGCVRDLKHWSRVAVEADVDSLRVDETYSAVENLIAQRLAEVGKAPQKDRPWAEAFRFAIPDRFPDMTGRLRVGGVRSPNFSAQNLDLTWNLKDIARELKTVSGHFQMGFGPGSMRNITEMQKAHPLVNVLLIPYVEMHKIRQKSRVSLSNAVPTGLDFTRVFGDFKAGAGLVGLNFIHFDSPPFQAYVAGQADFPKESVDLNVIMRMTEPAQNLPYSMVDDAGRLALDVSLVKDLNKPEVVFRGRKVGSGDIEKGLSEGLKRVEPFPDLDEAVACRRGG
ncbi:MAG: AsmA family protein [Elusimicrobia bacterium]|nr:AsmA family protein [Elusimicrobiota bacterium]